MRHHPILLIILFFVSLVSIPLTAQEITVKEPTLNCSEYFADGEMFKALVPCRDELEANPGSIKLQRILAKVEFVAGEPERSVDLWQAIVDSPNRDQEASQNLAMALWRSGKTTEAEAILLKNVEGYGSAETYRDLIGFYQSFDRLDEARQFGIKGNEKFPDSCELLEDRGVTEAALGFDKDASAFLDKAVKAGCPPFRWTTRGVLGQRLDNPHYAQLLAPKKLVADISELSDSECRDRLSLLKNTMSIEAAPAVTQTVIERRTSEVRLAALGLLTQLGAEAVPYWQQVLADDDFILRKHALRRLRELEEPAMTPLLEECIKMDLTPGNEALAKLTLGEYLMRAGKTERGEALILSIKEDNNLYAIGLLSLATFLEKADPARALTLIEKAQAHTPQLYVDPDRLKMLREKTAPQ